MKVTRDEKTLITTSEDGDIFIWNILDKQKRISPEAGWTLAAEVVTTKEELSSKNDKISSLMKEMRRLIEENEYRIKVQKMAQAKSHQDQVEKYLQEIDHLNQKLKEHSDLIQEINELRKELSSCRSKLRDFEIYFGISSMDLAESAAAKAKVDEALRLEKEGKRHIEKSILDRDKVIVNQSMEIRRLHTIMRFEEGGNSKVPIRYHSAPLPPIRYGSADIQQHKPAVHARNLEPDIKQDKGPSLERRQQKVRSETTVTEGTQSTKKRHRKVADAASSDAESISDQEDELKRSAGLHQRRSTLSSAKSED